MDAEKRVSDAVRMARAAGIGASAESRVMVASVIASAAIAEAIFELIGAVQELERTVKEAAGMR